MRLYRDSHVVVLSLHRILNSLFPFLFRLLPLVSRMQLTMYDMFARWSVVTMIWLLKVQRFTINNRSFGI